MTMLLRRHVLAATAAGTLAGAASAQGQTAAQGAPQGSPGAGSGSEPVKGQSGGAILGPRNIPVAEENPDILRPPSTDRGLVPNLKWPFAQSHMRLEDGGFARETTVRELPVSKSVAGVDMRLNAGGMRELHWHKASEWAYVLAGKARITAVDQLGRAFVADVAKGDLWFFPPGIPHSIQGLDPDGTEFLLVFDDGDFSEDNTFLLSEWFYLTPKDVLAKNFGWPESAFDKIPQKELYIFNAPLPGPVEQAMVPGAPAVPTSFSHSLLAQEPQRTRGGTVRIADTRNFPISSTTAAALIEVEPGGMRELHWHPDTDEWQYYIDGQARMTVFASGNRARTFDFQAGDVGFVPFAMGHYIENTGSTTMRYLEIFPSPTYEDVSLAQWMALTPRAIVEAHLHLPPDLLDSLRKEKASVVPA